MIEVQGLVLAVKGMELDLKGGHVWVTANTIESLVDSHVCGHWVWYIRQQYSMFQCYACLT